MLVLFSPSVIMSGRKVIKQQIMQDGEQQQLHIGLVKFIIYDTVNIIQYRLVREEEI